MKKREETFLLVSMKEEKAKRLAQVISSESCRRILDHLAGKEATETELAKELNMPLSTVHYNLQQLLAANLVKADEFHYSEKGKEVNHYSIANKFIIIAPDTKEGLSVRIKQTLPALAVLILGAGSLYLTKSLGDIGKTRLMAAGVAEAKAYAAAPAMAQAAPPIWLWFLLGGAVVLLALLITWAAQRRQ